MHLETHATKSQSVSYRRLISTNIYCFFSFLLKHSRPIYFRENIESVGRAGEVVIVHIFY